MKGKLKQFIAFGVASVVALAVCLGVLVVTVNNLDDSTGTSEGNAIVNKTELDSSNETLTKYFNKLILKTSGSFVKTKTYTDASVSDLKASDGSENQNKDDALLNFAKDKMFSAIDGFYPEDLQGTFEKNDSKKLLLALNENSLVNAHFSIGQVNENGESVYDDEGNLVDNEYYYLTYDIDVKNESFNKRYYEMLSLNEDLFAKEQFVDAVKNDCKISKFKAEPESVTIKAKVNRSTDKIDYINVIRNYAVSFKAEFINNAKLLGEKQISLIFTVSDTYEYSYAGISFVENEVAIEQGEEYMLNVNAVIDDDSEYTVEFTSSDDDIASVDEMGYVKFLKKADAPVTITVKLNYLGEAFTDTCIVNASEE